jgi:hypothetical protein
MHGLPADWIQGGPEISALHHTAIGPLAKAARTARSRSDQPEERQLADRSARSVTRRTEISWQIVLFPSQSRQRRESKEGSTMTADRTFGLLFGIVVTLAGLAFLAPMWAVDVLGLLGVA